MIDPRVRMLYYLLLPRPAQQDVEARKYLAKILEGIYENKGHRRSADGTKHTSVKAIVSEILKDLKEEKSNEVG